MVTPLLFVDHVTPEVMSTGVGIPETVAVAVIVSGFPWVTALLGLSVIRKFDPLSTHTVAEAVAVTL
jgi:hypothetical protein